MNNNIKVKLINNLIIFNKFNNNNNNNNNKIMGTIVKIILI